MLLPILSFLQEWQLMAKYSKNMLMIPKAILLFLEQILLRFAFIYLFLFLKNNQFLCWFQFKFIFQ